MTTHLFEIWGHQPAHQKTTEREFLASGAVITAAIIRKNSQANRAEAETSERPTTAEYARAAGCIRSIVIHRRNTATPAAGASQEIRQFNRPYSRRKYQSAAAAAKNRNG